jgi:hypothetical protein
MAFMLTRIQVGNYDAWKPQFDSDGPRARELATGYQVLRNAADPNEVFIAVEFASHQDAEVGRERLLASGVLDRFSDRSGPFVAELADSAAR